MQLINNYPYNNKAVFILPETYSTGPHWDMSTHTKEANNSAPSQQYSTNIWIIFTKEGLNFSSTLTTVPTHIKQTHAPSQAQKSPQQNQRATVQWVPWASHPFSPALSGYSTPGFLPSTNNNTIPKKIAGKHNYLHLITFPVMLSVVSAPLTHCLSLFPQSSPFLNNSALKNVPGS